MRIKIEQQERNAKGIDTVTNNLFAQAHCVRFYLLSKRHLDISIKMRVRVVFISRLMVEARCLASTMMLLSSFAPFVFWFFSLDGGGSDRA